MAGGGLGKNIVLCIDGTGNGPGGAEATNVWRLFEAVTELPGRQVKCYLPGVGANCAEPVYRPEPNWKLRFPRPPRDALAAWLARCGPPGRALAQGAGLGTADRITQAYAFLCHHYMPGDRIYLFGFSRGATAVRSLAGFMDTVGLLLQDSLEHVAKAYGLYVHPKAAVRAKLRDHVRQVTGVWIQCRGTYATLRQGDRIAAGRTLPARYRMSAHFLGVWDTVASLGRPGRLPEYHRTEMPPFVDRARHALAVHELRGWAFPPLLFTRCAGRDVEQVWFAGAHADVGGGYRVRGLADIALGWMLEEAVERVECTVGSPPRLLVKEGIHPRGGSAETEVLHEEISAGRFPWVDIPAVRRPLAEPGRLAAEVLASFAVHPSALFRLLDPQATRYGFPRGPWCAEVNGPLAEADDAVLRLQLSLLAPGPVSFYQAAHWLAGDRQRLDHRLEEARARHAGDPAGLSLEIGRVLNACLPVTARALTLLADGWWKRASVPALQAIPACIQRFHAVDGELDEEDARALAYGLALLAAIMAASDDLDAAFRAMLGFLLRGIGQEGLQKVSSRRRDEASRILDSVVRGFPMRRKTAAGLARLMMSLHIPPGEGGREACLNWKL